MTNRGITGKVIKGARIQNAFRNIFAPAKEGSKAPANCVDPAKHN